MSKIQNISINVKKSWQFWKSFDNLDKSWQSRLISTISIKIWMQPSLDWKILILKISTEKKKSWSWPSRKSWHFKKVSLDRKDILNLDLDWSRLSRPPTLYFLAFKTFDLVPKLVLTTFELLPKNFANASLKLSI